MQTLMDSTEGAYRVVTTDSSYLVDLDRMVIRRVPRTEDVDGSLLRRDDELVTLLQTVECSVGAPMLLLVDLHVLGVPFTTRTTTPVTSIDRVPSPGEQTR